MALSINERFWLKDLLYAMESTDRYSSSQLWFQASLNCEFRSFEEVLSLQWHFPFQSALNLHRTHVRQGRTVLSNPLGHAARSMLWSSNHCLSRELGGGRYLREERRLAQTSTSKSRSSWSKRRMSMHFGQGSKHTLIRLLLISLSNVSHQNYHARGQHRSY
jgi:hypothetical protein